MNSQNKIKKILFDSGCLWIEENPKIYHALLASGAHSNGFINMRNLYLTPEGLIGLETISKLIASKFKREYSYLLSEELVLVGVAYGGIIPAYLIGKYLELPVGWTEKVGDEVQTSKFSLYKKKVILVEDVLTTGSTITKATVGIKFSGGHLIDPIITLVNRSNSNLLGRRRVLSGIDLSIKTYDSEICPWCQKGSKAIKPKHEDNWNLLDSQK